jgi:hypothetical protein
VTLIKTSRWLFPLTFAAVLLVATAGLFAAKPVQTPAARPVPRPAAVATPQASAPAAAPAKASAAPTAAAKPAAEEAAAAGPRLYDLKYKFKIGETIRSEVVHRATVETSIQGSSQTAETRSKSVKSWKVTAISTDGTITFVNSVESIDLWQRMQGRQEVRYNSQTDKEIPPGYEAAARAVGVPLTVVTMDARGKILKREEKQTQPDTQAPQIAIPLPTEPAPIGHDWTAPQEIEVLLTGGLTKKIRTQQKFTLEKVSDGRATIHVETQVLTPVNDAQIEAQLIQRLSNGSIEFDLEAGRVLSQQLDLDRRVLGFSGPTSTMHYLTRYTEKLLPPTAETAAKTQAAKRK